MFLSFNYPHVFKFQLSTCFQVSTINMFLSFNYPHVFKFQLSTCVQVSTINMFLSFNYQNVFKVQLSTYVQVFKFQLATCFQVSIIWCLKIILNPKDPRNLFNILRKHVGGGVNPLKISFSGNDCQETFYWEFMCSFKFFDISF